MVVSSNSFYLSSFLLYYHDDKNYRLVFNIAHDYHLIIPILNLILSLLFFSLFFYHILIYLCRVQGFSSGVCLHFVMIIIKNIQKIYVYLKSGGKLFKLNSFLQAITLYKNFTKLKSGKEI